MARLFVGWFVLKDRVLAPGELFTERTRAELDALDRAFPDPDAELAPLEILAREMCDLREIAAELHRDPSPDPRDVRAFRVLLSQVRALAQQIEMHMAWVNCMHAHAVRKVAPAAMTFGAICTEEAALRAASPEAAEWVPEPLTRWQRFKALLVWVAVEMRFKKGKGMRMQSEKHLRAESR